MGDRHSGGKVDSIIEQWPFSKEKTHPEYLPHMSQVLMRERHRVAETKRQSCSKLKIINNRLSSSKIYIHIRGLARYCSRAKTWGSKATLALVLKLLISG